MTLEGRETIVDNIVALKIGHLQTNLTIWVISNFVGVFYYCKELAELKRETGRLSVGHTRAEERVLDEAKLRVDIEHRNKLLEEEMTKVTPPT